MPPARGRIGDSSPIYLEALFSAKPQRLLARFLRVRNDSLTSFAGLRPRNVFGYRQLRELPAGKFRLADPGTAPDSQRPEDALTTVAALYMYRGPKNGKGECENSARKSSSFSA
jgi:hypothetical protein